MPPILVTAFGPFDGRPENASSLALRGLKSAVPGIRTRILPVDSVVAPARLRRALNELRPATVVLLGEAAGSLKIRVETTAWNELDFRIPDIAGRQPRARQIRSGGPDRFSSTLPVDPILNRLAAEKHPVEPSGDPGRYLCNQLFYIAREWTERHAPACRAGFIHLPLAADYPTDLAVAALTSILGEL